MRQRMLRGRVKKYDITLCKGNKKLCTFPNYSIICIFLTLYLSRQDFVYLSIVYFISGFLFIFISPEDRCNSLIH